MSSSIGTMAGLVKFSHSVFALPFALAMVVFIAPTFGVRADQILWIVVCVVAARTAAMGFNRIVDAKIDAVNPRTANREIPAGVISPQKAWVLVGLSSAVFVTGAAMLGRHCVYLTPVVLAVLFGYSFMKRYSSFCHVVLGLALALAPGGVWYALTATWSWQPVPLMAAVLTWVSGFDILYSCQDVQFDRENKLQSIPAKIGVRGAIISAALLHVATVILLFVTGSVFERGLVYQVGVVAFGLIIASQYVAIYRRGIACIDQVFFTRNGLASIGFLVVVLLDSL